MNQLASRKFIVALLGVLSATGLSWGHHITADAYSAVMIAVVGLYGAANVIQKWAAK